MEGAVEEAKKTLLRQGQKKLGPSSDTLEARINALSNLDRLNDLLDRILDVSTWDELLPPPTLPAKARGTGEKIAKNRPTRGKK